ncbi:DUF2867 domain-containing protein [Sphaerisporangium fuscum]|uniref:DUF2867 domain-containing protein n=1 Tax=Sphaerisporangium fuscum TaxID=2835868 RepID=UPI001BDC7335|nr:DUF2867 domain-containing protein [Sphaerisporangium fuscum]
MNSHVSGIIDTTPELAGFVSEADHIDVKTAESRASLREFTAGAMSWRPGWLRALFRARAVLARLLRLRDPDVPAGRPLAPEEISLVPGDKIAFFAVSAAAEDRYIVLEAADTHLTARLAIVTTPSADGDARFDVITVVKYHRWTGPLYFNLIRPFHHLVVAGMTRAGASRAPGSTPS